ncbi:Nramp family divalent metal transporter [Robbsia sp. KACC 23696]|uniref:Nramp family divalent metal transporter n=1 Tax=Robbsia sp. KACC 23696 TaxID=3149231 RepID=UPI00325B59EB
MSSLPGALPQKARSISAFLSASASCTGPAVIASVGYLDPGNFATNLQAGASYGYRLLWVVVVANVIAMLFQAMSAKIGIVTNRNLPELCRQHFARSTVIGMWLASELAAMATDLAEFLGGALAFSLLLHLSLMTGMVLTGLMTYAILMLQKRGFRTIELVIGMLVTVIGISLLAEFWVLPQDWHGILQGTLTPYIGDSGAVTIAVGIIGATIMPHTLYLHSGLMQNRAPIGSIRDKQSLIRFSNREVVLALGFAGLVNMAMLASASAGFHLQAPQTADIGQAYTLLRNVLGGSAAGLFLIALLSSGVSSSVVGTMAGQIIMQGFVNFTIPVLLRRVITAAPAFVIVALGCDVSRLMILSQVVLSLVLPLPMIALLVLSRRPAVMGAFVSGRMSRIAAYGATVLILILNVYLLIQAVR